MFRYLRSLGQCLLSSMNNIEPQLHSMAQHAAHNQLNDTLMDKKVFKKPMKPSFKEPQRALQPHVLQKERGPQPQKSQAFCCWPPLPGFEAWVSEAGTEAETGCLFGL